MEGFIPLLDKAVCKTVTELWFPPARQSYFIIALWKKQMNYLLDDSQDEDVLENKNLMMQ